MKEKSTDLEISKRANEILQAARLLFSQRGYSGTTLQDIADKVGITKGTVYLYFKSKEDLLASVIEHEVRVLLREMEEVQRSSLPVEDRLVEMLFRALDYFRHERDKYRLFDPDVTRISPSLRAVFKKRLKPCFVEITKVIEETLREGIKLGRFKEMDTFKVAIMLQALLHGLHKSWSLGAKYQNSDRELLREMVLKGILKS